MRPYIFEVDKEAFWGFNLQELPDYIVVRRSSYFEAELTLQNFFNRLNIEEWGVVPRFKMDISELKEFKVVYL